MSKHYIIAEDIIRRTAKAILLKVRGEEVWMPKSQITLDEESMVVEVAAWLMADKGLADATALEIRAAKERGAFSIADDFGADEDADRADAVDHRAKIALAVEYTEKRFVYGETEKSHYTNDARADLEEACGIFDFVA